MRAPPVLVSPIVLINGRWLVRTEKAHFHAFFMGKRHLLVSDVIIGLIVVVVAVIVHAAICFCSARR